MIKTKKEFITKVRSMNKPHIFEFEEDSMYHNISFICKDLENGLNCFETNTIEFNPKKQNLEKYKYREEKFKQKINDWFKKATEQ